MKPGFALSLSFEGIGLLRRSAGGWRLVGEVALDADDLAAELADLRARGQALTDGEPLATKLILPNEQVRYLTVATGPAEGADREALVRAALDGATPYEVDDLVFDLSVEGDDTHVAAVARETLAEAEGFAMQHGFEPLGFVAVPGDMPFLGEPFFGPTRHAESLLAPGDRVEPDGIAVVVVGPAEAAGPPPADVLSGEIPPEEPGAPETEALPGFSSRRATTADEEPVPPPVSFEPPPQLEPEPDPEPAAPLAAPARATPPPDRRSGFFSRRAARAEPVAAAVPAPAPAPPPPAPVLAQAHVIAPPPAEDEAARMTIFGARQQAGPVGGKPRHLGLILTAALLMVLAAVAVWAALFLDEGVARLIPGSSQTETAATTPAVALDPVGTLTSRAQPDAAELEPEPDAPAAPTAVALSDTDGAVLDALRAPEPAEATRGDAETAQALYAATGIWPRAPVPPATPPPGPDTPDDLYPTSIDRRDLSQDAVALPAVAALVPDLVPAAQSSPAAAGTTFALDTRGLVVPTAAGALSPDGVTVFLGPPPVVPPPVPARLEEPDETAALSDLLSDFRPRPRPENLAELNERGRLGGRTLEELGAVRPRLRPESAQDAADAEAEAEDSAPASALAVSASNLPRLRPANLEQRAAAAAAARQQAEAAAAAAAASASTTAARIQPQAPTPPQTQTVTVAPRTVAPRIPSSASVSRQATLDNAINLRKVNLIGVYGTPANRRALIRLPNGRYQKVKVGDRVDGGRILAIGDSELRYQKGGRNLTLEIPSG